jgi:Flp pilus assembly protein TadD
MKVLVLLSVMLLCACQSNTSASLHQGLPLYDHAFSGYTDYPLETQEDIFALSDEAKKFAREAVKGVFDSDEQIRALARAIFARSEFNLLYRADANTVASDTFANRAANCLSLSIMTYALAKELGFAVRFQDVSVPEYWTRREGQRLLNGHVNLQIIPGSNNGKVVFSRYGFEVDFDRQQSRPHSNKRALSLGQITAMFYNNKGADALLNNNYDLAYSYFRKALHYDAQAAQILANLGYLYRRTDHHEYAEQAYKLAIQADESNLTAWQNLAFLYHLQKRDKEAATINEKLANKRNSNPYYFLSLGDAAYANHNWQTALDQYRKALELDKSIHEVFFGLGRVYFELGNISRSRYFLQQAKMKSNSAQTQQVYASKLEFLRRYVAKHDAV